MYEGGALGRSATLACHATDVPPTCLPLQTTAADGAVSRREALALLKHWYLTSTHSGTGKAEGGLATVGLGSTALSDGVALGGAVEGEEAARLWRDDGEFMGWVEGASGAARIAMELKVEKGQGNCLLLVWGRRRACLMDGCAWLGCCGQ